MSPSILNPPFDSERRTSPLVVCTFNLVATIIGGSVLSVPLAFQKSGIIVGTILMVFAAVITAKSLNLLCIAARKTGATSYGGVGKDAYGAWMDTSISALLCVFLHFVLVAYMVILRDIWTPLVRLLLPEISGDVVLFGTLVSMSPFLGQRTLHALRFNCYIGMSSISLLCLALVHHAFVAEKKNLKYFPEKIGDALFAFPIITLSFVSAFNVLSIQNALVRPTPERMESVINLAVLPSFVLMYSFGLGGYIYAQEETQGNILLNCNHDEDWMFLVGRIGYGITMTLALAIVMLPCRDSFLELVDLLVTTSPTIGSILGEETSLLSNSTPRRSIQENPFVHYGATFGITLVTYVGASMAPGVAIVWSLCGSSMAFVVSFILPAACYLELEKKMPAPSGTFWTRLLANFLILFSLVGMVACTGQTILMMTRHS